MFRVLSIVVVLFFSASLKAQDTVRLVHKQYISVFSKSLKYPVLVEWWVTKEKVSCLKLIPRQDRFAPDPLLFGHTDLASDYVGSGYDRGHMAPAADNQCPGQDATATAGTTPALSRPGAVRRLLPWLPIGGTHGSRSHRQQPVRQRPVA